MKTLITVILFCASGFASAAINTCVDADGKKTFTDQPCGKFALKDITPAQAPTPVPASQPVKSYPSVPYKGYPILDIPYTPSRPVERNEHNVLVNIWAAGARLDWPMRFFIVGFLFPMFFILCFYLFDFFRRRLGAKAAAQQ